VGRQQYARILVPEVSDDFEQLDRRLRRPTQRLSAWRISITLVPSLLRLGSGAYGCHGRTQAPVMPKTTYCGIPANIIKLSLKKITGLADESLDLRGIDRSR
jgi:hypothetical protein